MIMRIGTTINPIGCEDHVWCLDFVVMVTRLRSDLDLSHKIYLDNSFLFRFISLSSDELQNVSGTLQRGISGAFVTLKCQSGFN